MEDRLQSEILWSEILCSDNIRALEDAILKEVVMGRQATVIIEALGEVKLKIAPAEDFSIAKFHELLCKLNETGCDVRVTVVRPRAKGNFNIVQQRILPSAHAHN